MRNNSLQYFEFTAFALQAQAILDQGVCPESCLAWMKMQAAQRIAKRVKLSKFDRLAKDSYARSNNAQARCSRINSRMRSRVAKLKMRLEYVKQGICPFSFEAYTRGVPVRGFYALARGQQASLSARFCWNPLTPRKALKQACV